MNNSAEAENPHQKLFNYLSKEHGVDLMENELLEIVRITTPIVLEKELASLTDEVIEGIFPDLPNEIDGYKDWNKIYWWQREGAKALRDYLKQNNLKK